MQRPTQKLIHAALVLRNTTHHETVSFICLYLYYIYSTQVKRASINDNWAAGSKEVFDVTVRNE